MRYLSCYPTKIWENYNHPVVRDLAWMFFAPSLLNDSQHAQLDMVSHADSIDSITRWLTQLDQYTPDALDTLINRHNFTRLGVYGEALFDVITTYANQHQAFHLKLMSRNIQIFKPKTKITLGELDFLVRDNHRRIYHIEMATKFYLLDDTQRLATRNNALKTLAPTLIGPNQKDRLDIKLHRLTHHQLPLAHSRVAFEQLSAQKTIEQAISTPSKLFLKGQLFHYYLSQAPAITDVYMDKEALWVHCAQHHHALQLWESNVSHLGESRWQVLSKLNWLAGEKASKAIFEQALQSDALAQRVNQQAYRDLTPPILLQQYIRHDKTIKKGIRLMIVGDDWPKLRQ